MRQHGPDDADHTAAAVPGLGSPAAVRDRLAQFDYLADDGLATAVFLALRTQRPLFLEGEAGVGKTAVAHTLARALDAPLVRLQCYEGIDASQALYDCDFPRQLLHLRAAEAGGIDDAQALEAQLYDRRFLIARPLLQALETNPCVLLIDEIDRADDEFEAFLLEILSEFTVTVPELGTLHADEPPTVVITSNRTREVHDALKRRCYYHWLEHPDFEREIEILRVRLPEVSERLAREVTSVTQALRQADLLKPPGVAESIDWARALVVLDVKGLDADIVMTTLGAALKYREDQERARQIDVADLVQRALTGT
ncbi:MAG TPA: MoxR family ATPase [Euzebyales bacterium]|nr:MoxR family ATPase [Euzebyales bacterium]